MAYTHHELKHKTLAELRDIAKDIEHDAVQGYTQLNKEHLVVAICKALNIMKCSASTRPRSKLASKHGRRSATTRSALMIVCNSNAPAVPSID